MKNIRLYMYYVLSFCLLSLQMQSQTQSHVQNRFVLNVDYSRFWQNDSTMFVEISTAVYPNLTILTQDSLGYHGKIELSITIQDTSSGVFVNTDRFTIPMNFIDSVALAKTKSMVNNATYTLRCGLYKVSVLGVDASNRSRRDSSMFFIDIIKRPDTIALSDIELCSSITESSDQKDVFYKNTYRVIPNPNCVYGSTTFPLVLTYMEFYNLKKGMTYSIKAQIVDSKGDVKKQRTHLRRFSIPNVVDVTTLNVTSISSGKYNYVIILSDTLGNEIAKSHRPIFLYNPNVQSAQAQPLSEGSAVYAGFSLEDLAEEFRVAKYITQSEDNNAFDKLTTLGARQEFMQKFWTRIEREELGRLNLTRSIYMQRVETANQRYKTQAKEGWRTDRGRVLILYGEPDEIQRFTYSMDRKPYEIWNYHQIEGGVEFDFVDLIGFNEYLLVNSTKRDEIKDDSWQQLLNQ
ncbi:MAG: GWxTD domain-containing protein [Ignavibacteriales bacterium]|nr:GWxTD domain-containing protein [Ignavibacteriales bacterium]